MQWNAPPRLTASVFCHWSSENRITRPLIATPALLTRMSSPPWSLPIALIASVTAAELGDVEAGERGLATGGLDRGGGLARRVLARGVVDDDLRAALAERDRDRAADPARRAGDQRDLAVQCLVGDGHELSLPRFTQ